MPVATCRNADSVSDLEWKLHEPFNMTLPFFPQDTEVYTEVDNILSIKTFGDLRVKILGERKGPIDLKANEQ